MDIQELINVLMSSGPEMPLWLKIYQNTYLVGYAIVAIPTAIAWWIVHQKAGRPGWTGLIPFANLIILSKIVGGPIWGAILMMITLTAPLGSLFVLPNMAEAFGKERWVGYLSAVFPPVMFWIVAFSDATYQRGELSNPDVNTEASTYSA